MKKEEVVVARIGSGSITKEELEARLAEQPPLIRSRYTTLERKKEFLRGLVRSELLVQEAREQGLERDPEVQAAFEKLLVQKLLQKHSAAAGQAVTEEELTRYYQEHLTEFMRPGLEQTLHLARPHIESRIQMERRSRAIDALVAALEKRTPIEINDQLLEQLDAGGTPVAAPGPAGDVTRL